MKDRLQVRDELVVGWRWSRIWLAAAGLGVFVAGATVAIVVGDLAAVDLALMWAVLVFFASVLAAHLGIAVAFPVALRVDERGIDLRQAGPIPWSAITRCSITRYRGMRMFSVIVDREAMAAASADWVTPRLRRALRHGQTRDTALCLFDVPRGQLALTLKRHGVWLDEHH